MSLKFLNTYSHFGIVILRVGLGVMFIAAHGSSKLFGGPERWEAVGKSMQNIGVTFAPVIWGFLAAVTEFGGGVLLTVGLWVRPVCVPLLFTMFMATMSQLARGNAIFGSGAHPVEVGIALLALLFLGGGRYSLDQKLGNN